MILETDLILNYRPISQRLVWEHIVLMHKNLTTFKRVVAENLLPDRGPDLDEAIQSYKAEISYFSGLDPEMRYTKARQMRQKELEVEKQEEAWPTPGN